MTNGIDFIICGLEHSGTTLASDLVRSPSCDSGFECGVLLADNPRGFQSYPPFSQNILSGWQITEDQFNECCQEDTFSAFYDKLYFYSALFDENLIKKRFDKTPRYITQLKNVLQKHEAPVLALIKDPRSIAWSDFRRSKQDLQNLDHWYDQWMPAKKRYMKSAYDGYQHAWEHTETCLVIRLEELCLEVKSSLNRLDEFLNIPFNLTQLFFPSKRYQHTKGSSIDVGIAVSWMEEMPIEYSNKIRDDFSEFDRWFYEV